METVIEVKDLYKLYRVGDSAVRALNGVSLKSIKASFVRSSEHRDRENLRF